MDISFELIKMTVCYSGRILSENEQCARGVFHAVLTFVCFQEPLCDVVSSLLLPP